MTLELFDFFIQNDNMSNVKTEITDNHDSVFYADFLTDSCCSHTEVKHEIDITMTSETTSTTVDQGVTVKLEPIVPPEDRSQYVYKCRICKKMLQSKYAFTCHVNKHTKRCNNCRLVFKTWKQVEDHEDFCSRRFGRIVLPKRSKPSVPKKLLYKCQLCKRKYETKEHLFKYQFIRCSKRYITPAWIVKI